MWGKAHVFRSSRLLWQGWSWHIGCTAVLRSAIVLWGGLGRVRTATVQLYNSQHSTSQVLHTAVHAATERNVENEIIPALWLWRVCRSR